MDEIVSGIDHPVIAVVDMEQARTTYERLGFTIPPRGSHLEWGTGNWCIMFPQDYLELRGIIDASKYAHDLDKFLEQGEGPMGIALATPDAQLAHAQLTQCAFNPRDVMNLTRNFELPAGPVQPRFHLCFLSDAETYGLMSVVFCQHLTPELLRRPEWLVHENRAQGVSSMTCVVPNLEVARQTHERQFGTSAVECSDTVLCIRVAERGMIRMLTRQGFHSEYASLADAVWPREKFIAAVALDVEDLAVCEALLNERDVRHTKVSDSLVRVAPQEACGVILEFEASTGR